MYTLNKQELGSRIVALRKLKGLSQDNLAKAISISRPSIVQIELGKRSVDIFEMHKLSSVLGFSIDEFLSQTFMSTEEPTLEYITQSPKTKVRISEPVFNFSKCKNILLYVLEKTAGKVNINEAILFKILYFIDFNYFEKYESHLSTLTYRKLSNSPIPKNIDSIIKILLENETVLRIKTKVNGNVQLRYIPLEQSNLTKILASEKETIDAVIETIGDYLEEQINFYAQNDIPNKVTKESEDINYELAFYREAPYTVRNYNEQNEV